MIGVIWAIISRHEQIGFRYRIDTYYGGKRRARWNPTILSAAPQPCPEAPLGRHLGALIGQHGRQFAPLFALPVEPFAQIVDGAPAFLGQRARCLQFGAQRGCVIGGSMGVPWRVICRSVDRSVEHPVKLSRIDPVLAVLAL